METLGTSHQLPPSESKVTEQSKEESHPQRVPDRSVMPVSIDSAGSSKTMSSGDHLTSGGLVSPQTSTSMMSHETINQEAQMLIDSINSKRNKKDTALLQEFKKSLDAQAAAAYVAVEKNLFQAYEEQNIIIESKVQELFATLDRVAKLEEELDKFKLALGALYSDMHQPTS